MFNTETWVNVSNQEIKSMNQGHYHALRKIFEQRESTPYYGILMETGIWPYSYVILYKRLMYFHHLLHSDERRIARQIVINQMKGLGKGKTWYQDGVRGWLTKFGLEKNEEEMLKISKSAWKKAVKEKIESTVKAELEKEAKTKTKLRFTTTFGRQDYTKECRMEEVKMIMKIRLNMVELKANFRGKYKDNLCPACKQTEETTEHVILCPEYKALLQNTLEINQLQEQMSDVKWVREACKVYEQIEATRKWLL